MRKRLIIYGILIVALYGLWQAGPWAFWAIQRYGNAAGAPDTEAGAARITTTIRHEAPLDTSTLPLRNARIVVDKSERQLTLYDGDREIKRYKIGLGGAPEGHKEREGDQRTPVGNYHLCNRTKSTAFWLFLGLNYPNAADARAALAGGRIDTPAAEAIIGAENARQTPPWDTVLGGAVGIHGSGNFADWTLGCIALDNADVEEIWAACPGWTPVKISE